MAASKTPASPAVTRPIHEIAADIRADWTNVYFGAVPYLCAMGGLADVEQSFGEDPADDVLIYFLSNATTWRGPVAREIKAEIKALLKKGK